MPTLSYLLEGKIAASEGLEVGLVVACTGAMKGFFSPWTYMEHCLLSVYRTRMFRLVGCFPKASPSISQAGLTHRFCLGLSSTGIPGVNAYHN